MDTRTGVHHNDINAKTDARITVVVVLPIEEDVTHLNWIYLYELQKILF